MDGNIRNFIKSGGLTFSACLLSVIILPLYIHILPPVIILWILFFAVEKKLVPDDGAKRDKKAFVLFFLFVIFFLWQISGLLWTGSIDTGFERLAKRLSFVLFPLVLYYPGLKIQMNIKLILKIFALGTLVYVLYCFGNALDNSLIEMKNQWIFYPHPKEYDYENFFYGMRFSFPFHPSYLAMYIILSVLILLESLFDRGIKLMVKCLLSISILILLIALYLLSARAGILAGILIFPLYFFFRFYKKLPKWILILGIGSLAATFTVVAKKNDKVGQMISSISREKIGETFRKDPRLLIWKSAIGVIGKHPVLGVGTGDATRRIKEEFVLRGYFEGYYDNMNAHNQFLEIWIENGIIGLLLFLSILSYMIYISINQHNLLLGLYTIAIIIFFIFETMLNRIAGVSFFALMSFLLIQLADKKRII